jgi:hypothetical protein
MLGGVYYMTSLVETQVTHCAMSWKGLRIFWIM